MDTPLNVKLLLSYQQSWWFTLGELRDHTVTEIGCHLYLLHESMEESTQCIFIYESFHSQADFEFHAQQDYMKEIFNLFETQLEKPVEITHLTNL